MASMPLIVLLAILNTNSVATVGAWRPSTLWRLPRPRQQQVTLRARKLPWWCCPADDEEGSITRKIEEAFNNHMARQDLPLFVDFHAYSASLPVREVQGGAPLSLYQVPCFMSQRDLDRAVACLPRNCDADKDGVAYLAAPSGSGKSASVLPMFLRSRELGRPFTHYIYMPFANNGGRCHRPVQKDRRCALDMADTQARFGGFAPDLLEEMGAAYMLECFQKQLQNTYWRGGQDLLAAPRKDSFASDLRQEVEKVLERTPGGQIFLHIDEHKMMSSDADFRRGALSVWGEVNDLVTVIATYTDLPNLPPKGSSATCRRPVPKPMFDVSPLLVAERAGLESTTERQLVAGYPTLKVPTATDGREKQLLASFRVLLGLAITRLGLGKLHTGSDVMRDFMAGVQQALDMPGQPSAKNVDKLVNAVLALPLKLPPSKSVTRLVDLLLGVPEDEASQGRFPFVVAMEERITAPLETLLSACDRNDPLNQLFVSCQTLLKQSLRNVSDLCEGKVLERAFLLALACRAGRGPGWSFTEEGSKVCFQCSAVAPGRIFPRGDRQNLEVQLVKALKQETLYYADEGEKVGAHPTADLWFKTEENELIILDVSGSANSRSCMDKIHRMCWTVGNETNSSDFEALSISQLRGVVLLPNLEAGPGAMQGDVEVVFGRDAQLLLGGLSQLLTWPGDDLLD